MQKNISLTVIDCYALSSARVAAHCLSAGALLTALIVSSNLFTIGSFIHVITEIYEDC